MAGDPKLSGNVLKLVAQFEARIGQRARQFEGKRLDKVGFDTAHDDKTYAALNSHASGAGRRLTDSTPLNTLDLSVARVCTRISDDSRVSTLETTSKAKGILRDQSSAVETDNKSYRR